MLRYIGIVLGGLLLAFGVLPFLLVFVKGNGGPVVVWTTVPLCIAAVWQASKPAHRPYVRRYAPVVVCVILMTLFFTLPLTVISVPPDQDSRPYAQALMATTVFVTVGVAVWMYRRSAKQ